MNFDVLLFPLSSFPFLINQIMSHYKEHNRKALIQFDYQYSAYIIDKGFINLYKHYNKYYDRVI